MYFLYLQRFLNTLLPRITRKILDGGCFEQFYAFYEAIKYNMQCIYAHMHMCVHVRAFLHEFILCMKTWEDMYVVVCFCESASLRV